jgi:PIN domain nuclease of toxin-antitoxin system
LPPRFRIVIDDAIGQLWISPVSVWEVGMLHARGRIDLRGGPRRWVDDALRGFPLQEAALTSDVALRSHDLEIGHRDPADHLLAATALVHGLTLITMDERLADDAWLTTRSA